MSSAEKKDWQIPIVAEQTESVEDVIAAFRIHGQVYDEVMGF